MIEGVEHELDAMQTTRERSGRSAVDIERVVDCPFSFAHDEADAVFGILEQRGATATFRSLGLPLGGSLAHRVDVRFARRRDTLERGRSHDEIPFSWTARAAWLPNLDGVLRFRIATLRTRVLLHGEYVPPFGVLGRAFDRIAGRRLALATLMDMLDDLAQLLETEYNLFESRLQAVPENPDRDTT